MGQEESTEAPKYTVQDGFAREQFQKQRNANNPEMVLSYLSKIGTDLSKQSPKVPFSLAVSHAKILFIVCNTYTTEKYKLGVGPLNDSLTVAVNHKKMGYDIFYLHNTTSSNFRDWLKLLLKNAQSDLTIFYTGHGCSVPDNDGDESDGFDEVMLFDDSYVRDDDLARYLREYRNPTQRTILLSDCCHSGSIWDLQSAHSQKIKMPQNIMSISAAKDDQTAKQLSLDAKDQGIFTFYFWKYFNENPLITVKEMQTKLTSYLTRYNQHLEYSATSDSMLKEPIFTAAKNIQSSNQTTSNDASAKNVKSRDIQIDEGITESVEQESPEKNEEEIKSEQSQPNETAPAEETGEIDEPAKEEINELEPELEQEPEQEPEAEQVPELEAEQVPEPEAEQEQEQEQEQEPEENSQDDDHKSQEANEDDEGEKDNEEEDNE